MLLLTVLLVSSCLAEKIIRHPDNTTAFLNDTGEFRCVTDGGVSSWRINGTYLEQLSVQLRRELMTTSSPNDDGSTLLTLSFPAKTQYNGTRIQCVSSSFDVSTAVSRNVFLFVQGTLSAVSGLKTYLNSTSVTVTWIAPFSLDVTGVDPDIWYSVLIYNVTDEDSSVPINCFDCTNIPNTHYVFEESFTPCDVYNFAVVPFNGVGEGELSPNITVYIQFTTVEVSHSNTLSLTGVILINEGVESFIVMESSTRKKIIFRAIPLIHGSVCSTKDVVLRNVAPDTYNVLFYFIGRGASEHRKLYELMDVAVTGEDDSPSSVTSEILNGAKIVYNDAQRVDVECYFKVQIEQHSCVLVYREYGNETIVVREYPQTTEFPVTATVSNNNYYTIAIFGKRNGFVDEEPIISVENVNPDDTDDNLQVAAVVVPVVIVFLISVLMIFTCLVVCVKYRRSTRSESVSSPQDIQPDGGSDNKVKAFSSLKEEMEGSTVYNPLDSVVAQNGDTEPDNDIQEVPLNDGPLSMASRDEALEANYDSKLLPTFQIPN